ncbi:MAG: UDP-N-acetylmuramoyl-L-alanine--D-glutamate ligase [Phycisphaeraceae bacterium]|nr:UDP-N-acetylmuramoyl-L-alanine--D-glutamate ligase [Phycisphaeraceae bacterium]
MNLQGKKALVMGLGRFGGGVGVTRFLAARGAQVTVTDTAPADDLKESVARLSDVRGVSFHLGEHRTEDFTTADLVVVNPAVPPDNPYVAAARATGVALTSEIRLLVRHLPNRLHTIGITGSAGKSTTTAMIGHILRHTSAGDHSFNVHVGGNIGGSLLGVIDTIKPNDWVVLELSSFMLEGLREEKWSPHIAVITNLQPNHLDWHGSFEAYQHAKQALLDYQREADDDITIGGPGIHNVFTPRVSNFSFFERDDLALSPPIELIIPGEHNQLNARLAAAVVKAAIHQPEWESWKSLADFGGLTHRMQFVAEHSGVRYFNDSKATTPDATELAIKSFPRGKVHLILGGYDKGIDLLPLARLAARHCHAIYTIGKTGDTIAAAAEAEGHDATATHGPSVGVTGCGGAMWGDDSAAVIRCGTLDRAMAEIADRVRQGDVVLLSTACASWDQFVNFESRGAAFVEAVLKYTGEGSKSPGV